MPLQPDFVTYVEDLFSVVSGTSVRKMFGGLGIFRNGLMYALAVSNGRIALNADEQTIPDFEAEGCEEWLHRRKNGVKAGMGYWYIPERLTDNCDELLAWSMKAYEVALRADACKPPGKRKVWL